MSVGTVYLIGAGPGDPRLITVGGMQALQKADVVVYDRLAHPDLLRYSRDSAERVYVGKKADQHAMLQDDINALLAEKALDGKCVARLKGGDPFVFGRGGEEAEYLGTRSIPWVLIPGVTSAIAAPAYAGIPVTHRDAASSFAVITGHERDDSRESGMRAPGKSEGRRQWDKIANAADTLIFLMGVENLNEIAGNLLANGREPSTPVALVRWGTWAGQQGTLVGTLADIVEQVRDTKFKAPAVTVVGDVVNLRERLRWFDLGPLSGKRIVVTRAREQSSAFASLLRDRYAEPIEFPLIKAVAPTQGFVDFDTALQALSQFDWVLFLSVTAVHAFFSRMTDTAFGDSRSLAGVKIGAVGKATANALSGFGITTDFTSVGTTGHALGAELPDIQPGSLVLIPRAKVGDQDIVDALTARGATIAAPTIYETVIDGLGAELVQERLRSGTIDVVTFTSSSTVMNFIEAVGSRDLGTEAIVACIGPSTAETAERELGRKPEIVAKEHTVTGLVAALEDYYSSER